MMQAELAIQESWLRRVEEVVERTLPDSGRGGDLLHGHVRHAVFAKQRNTCFKHPFSELFALICIKNPNWHAIHPLCEHS